MRLTSCVLLGLGLAACITGTQRPAGDGPGSDGGKVDPDLVLRADGAKDSLQRTESGFPDGPRKDGSQLPPDIPSVDALPPDLNLCECHGALEAQCGECGGGTKTCQGCYFGPCVCNTNATKSCGDCGTSKCQSDCTWGSCTGQGCHPGSTQPCPNGCGQKTCTDSCTWGSCSGEGNYLGPSGVVCWSANHCSMGVGKCVDCWNVCDSNGNPVKDGWCAGGCEGCAGHIDQC